MNKAKVGGALLVLGLLCSGSRASAAPRTHDGFQFRGALGGGYLSDSEKLDVPAGLTLLGGPTATIHGGAIATEVYFGGTPAAGLVVGGFLSEMRAFGPSVSFPGGQTVTASGDRSLNLLTLGPYVDFYPDPTSGFHILGTLGLAVIDASNGDSTNSSAASSGFGIGGGLGYDWWVADEWSLGVLGRFTYAAMGHTTSGVNVTDNAIAPALLFSACFQ
jgi:hypothetical protein